MSDGEHLRLLAQHCETSSVRITGYCLMGNHVHLLAIPKDVPHPARRNGSSVVFSCPLDDRHQWEALRYVELNPVRSGLAECLGDWAWSSAAAHRTGADPAGLLDLADRRRRWTPEVWGEVLELGLEDAAPVERIREATRTGRCVHKSPGESRTPRPRPADEIGDYVASP